MIVRAWSAALAAAIVAWSAISPARAQTSRPYEAPTHALSPRVQQHLDQAYLALNGAVSDQFIASHVGMIAPGVFGPPMPPAGTPQLPATRVFDQLYYLGVPSVSAWALVTSDGIILIDTLDNADEARDYIEAGLKSVGLDPGRIKYILITHAHADHYGGAKYLQDKFHARVLMSAADWDFAAANAGRFPPARFGPVPARDLVVEDGQTLSLGQTRLKLYVTPGHTPGAVSSIFTVTDHGKPHVVSFMGGTGLQTIDRDPAKGGFATMRASLQRFAKLSVDAGADVVLANHPFTDGAYRKVAAERTRQPHLPWVAGKDAVLRFYVAFIEMVGAVEAYYAENPDKRAGG